MDYRLLVLVVAVLVGVSQASPSKEIAKCVAQMAKQFSGYTLPGTIQHQIDLFNGDFDNSPGAPDKRECDAHVRAFKAKVAKVPCHGKLMYSHSADDYEDAMVGNSLVHSVFIGAEICKQHYRDLK